MNKGTAKIKAISTRALVIREKAGFTTETITKKRYKMAYIPDAIKRAAKEMKVTEKPKAAKEKPKEKVKKRTVKTKQLARRKVKRTGTNSKSGAKVVDKKISVSVQKAIEDVLTLDKYSSIKPLAGGLIYNKFNKQKEVEVSTGEMAYPIFEKLEKIDFLEDIQRVSLYRKDTVTYCLSEKGKQFIRAVKGRIETLKGKKYGYNLF